MQPELFWLFVGWCALNTVMMVINGLSLDSIKLRLQLLEQRVNNRNRYD